MAGSLLDITLDFRTDCLYGKDPDIHSPILRAYHKLLWSKPLPTGEIFALNEATGKYLVFYRSESGDFSLSSDSAIPTFSNNTFLKPILDKIPLIERIDFQTLTYTIGGFIIFPAGQIDRKMTINGARGLHPLIRDRFDLSLECIRRFYDRQPSPLADALSRYSEFFELFVNFRNYVDFFLLQDLVTEDYSAVRFFLPFGDFQQSPLPSNVDSYLRYRHLTIKFIKSRAQRMIRC